MLSATNITLLATPLLDFCSLSQCHTPVVTLLSGLHHSKLAYFIPLTKLSSAKETAELVLLHVFCLHGLPVDVGSIRIPSFNVCYLTCIKCSVQSGLHLNLLALTI